MKKTTRGFTLVELLIVVAVIAILVTIAIISYNGVQGHTRDTRRKTDITAITKALELYYDDNGQYPVASGTDATIGPSWYASASGTTSWTTTFDNLLAGSIDNLPIDPTNSAGSILTAGNFSYAYFSGNYCGKPAGQWYLILYRLETMPKEKRSDGTCGASELGDTYFLNNGLSYYRFVR